MPEVSAKFDENGKQSEFTGRARGQAPEIKEVGEWRFVGCPPFKRSKIIPA